MKQFFDRYFELFPLIAIIVILVGREYRQQHVTRPVAFERPVIEYAFPPMEVQMPRVIVR